MEASQHIEPANTDCGQGAAIVLLHGFPFNRTMWREQIEFLTVHNFRVLAPDLRGLGENKSDDEVATMEDMARDIAVLMDRLKIDRATICGSPQIVARSIFNRSISTAISRAMSSMVATSSSDLFSPRPRRSGARTRKL